MAELEYTNDAQLAADITRMEGQGDDAAPAGSESAASSEGGQASERGGTADAEPVHLDAQTERNLQRLRDYREETEGAIAAKREELQRDIARMEQLQANSTSSGASDVELRNELMRSPHRFLRRLNIPEHAYGHLSKLIYYSSPDAQKDPAVREASATQLALIDMERRLEEGQREAAEWRSKFEEQQQQRATATENERQTQEFIAQAKTALGDRKAMAGLMKNEDRFVMALHDAVQALIGKKAPVTMSAVLDEAERQQREFLGLYGFDPYANSNGEATTASAQKDSRATEQSISAEPEISANSSEIPDDVLNDSQKLAEWFEKHGM